MKAVLESGTIRPLGALPVSWREGQELEIREADPWGDGSDETWLSEFKALSDAIPADDHDRMADVLAKQRRECRHWVAREMGLNGCPGI